MNTKLTLKLDGKVIDRAKKYAQSHRISLSRMIETYLDSVTKPSLDTEKPFITPLVESLSGVMDLPADFDYKKEYRDFLEEKYK
jgi:hypothetical protein